ncbi:MAG TPA: NlpC/P60 family protein, partial [Ferruginibacter sp.]|nr:NlpC/P60 family protein [Ferruginibacter sp.]
LRMQNFILVSVAIGIFSGTTLTANAQTAVNTEQVNAPGSPKKQGKFIEGIEINAASTASGTPVTKNRVTTGEMVTVNNDGDAIEKFTLLQFKYAQLLDMDVESVTNNALLIEIEKWWGTRYKYGGATEKGIDCSAYTGTLVHKLYGLVLPRTSHEQYEECSKLEKDELQQGDLVFFKNGRRISHVGLYLGNGYFTHASTSIGVTISHLTEEYWSRKYIGGGRINTLAIKAE